MHRTWVITENGLETEDGSYHIDAAGLGLETEPGISRWMLHMAEKTWVDMQEFGEKFRKALQHHGIDDNFNWADMEEMMNHILLKNHISKTAERNITKDSDDSVNIIEISKLFMEIEKLETSSEVRANAPRVKYT